MEKFKLKESILAGRLILLQRRHEHDADVWQAIEESRSFLREYLFWVDNTKTYADVVKATDMFAKKWDEDGEWCYNLYSLPDNRFLGCIGVHGISFMNQTAELGYWLRLSETGKGYMAEAVQALENELFLAGIHRVEIRCDVHNFNSANVAKRAGYTLESTAKEALYHYTGLHDRETYVKISPYPIRGFERKI